MKSASVHPEIVQESETHQRRAHGYKSAGHFRGKSKTFDSMTHINALILGPDIIFQAQKVPQQNHWFLSSLTAPRMQRNATPARQRACALRVQWPQLPMILIPLAAVAAMLPSFCHGAATWSIRWQHIAVGHTFSHQAYQLCMPMHFSVPFGRQCYQCCRWCGLICSCLYFRGISDMEDD